MNNNIVILDDHPMFLIGLKRVIDRDSEFTVSDCCKNSSDLFFSLSLVKADIVMLDCSRPEGDDEVITIINDLHQRFPNTAIITMGDCDKHRALSEQMQPGVAAHFYKSLTPEDLVTGLRATWLEYKRGNGLIVEPVETRKPLARQRLSAREKRVIEYIHAGFTVSQTAARFQRSVKTISAQKRAAMYKLGIKRDSDIFRLKINEI